MAVQESAAQLSMTLKVQEYPTLKVGAEPPPGTEERAEAAGVSPEQCRGLGDPGVPAPPAPPRPLPASATPGTAGSGCGGIPACPSPVFRRLTPRRLVLSPSPSAEGEGRAWNMLRSPGVSVP